MIRYHAAWVVPIEGEPIKDGWVTVDRGRVVALGRRAANDATPGVELGDVAVMPGLVNAHTHLELSYLRDQIAPASSFTAWARQIIYARRMKPTDPMAMQVPAGPAIDDAIDECLRCGTAVIGDIGNTHAAFRKIAASALAGVFFWELIGFNLDADERGFDAIVAHAIDDLKELPAA